MAGGVYELAHGAAPSSSSPASSSAAGPAVPAPAASPALPYQHAGGQDRITPVMTGTDYTPGNLSSQVAAQLGRHGRGATLAGPNAMTPSDRGPAAAPGRLAATFGNLAVSDLAGCVNRIAAGELVLLVDVARYQGRPATVIVTKAPAAGPEQIWVVGTGCSASRSDVLKHATLSTAG